MSVLAPVLFMILGALLFGGITMLHDRRQGSQEASDVPMPMGCAGCRAFGVSCHGQRADADCADRDEA